jgi:Mrp family chromosome partitioning ATPase
MPVAHDMPPRRNMPVPVPLLRTNDKARSAGERLWEEEESSEPPLAVPAVPLNGFVPEAPSIEELQLAQRLFFLTCENVPRTIVFCGVEAGDGAETLCARTGEVLSCLVKDTVCMMDANLRAPTLHLRYEIDDAGMALGGGAIDPSKERSLIEPNLWVLPAVALRECRPGLAPDQVRHRLMALRRKFGFLLISAPPLSTATEGYLLGQMADGVVLSVMARSTQRAVAMKVRRNLELYNVRLLGAVLNEPPVRKPGALRKKEC